MAARRVPVAKKRSLRKDGLIGKKLFPTGKVSSKGWVVIPKEIRDEMGLKPGDEVQFAVLPPLPNMKQDKALNVLQIIRVPEDPVALLSGLFSQRPGEPSWTENLLKERRRELEQEEREIRGDRRRRKTSA